MDVEDYKDDLRTAIRASRERKATKERARLAASLAEVLLTEPRIAGAKTVACYVAVGHEPATEPIMDLLRQRGIRILLPVLGEGLTRDWAEDLGPEQRAVNAPGRPPEPSTPRLGPEGIAEADVILAPALGIDWAGNRLGQGGGWYDRALAFADPRALVVGLIYDEEFHEDGSKPLPTEPHDRQVHAAATPNRWIQIG